MKTPADLRQTSPTKLKIIGTAILTLFCALTAFLASQFAWCWLSWTLFPPVSEPQPEYMSKGLYWCAEAIISSALAFGVAILCARNHRQAILPLVLFIIIGVSWANYQPSDMTYSYGVPGTWLPFIVSATTIVLLYFIFLVHDFRKKSNLPLNS